MKILEIKEKPNFPACTLILVLTVLSIGTPMVRAHSNDDSSLKVGEAEASVSQAFNVVLEAERAGANVSTLLVRLGEAGQLLADARTAYSNGEFTLAVERAEHCSALASSVLEDASALKDSALAESEARLRERILFSAISAPVFIAALLFVWVRFKRSYGSRMLKLKPEMGSDAEAQ